MQRTLRRTVVAGSAVAAACALLLAIAWVTFPQLAPVVASPFLAQRGFELETLQIRRPHRQGIHVAELELRSSDGRLALRGRRLTLSWASPASLLREGPTHAGVDTLDIDLGAAPHAPTPAVPGVTGVWLAELPVPQLAIRHLHVALVPGPGDPPLTLTGSLQMDRQEGRFDGTLRHPRLPAPLSIRTTLDHHNRIFADLRETSRSPALLELDGLLTSAPVFLGRVRGDVDALGSWLETAGERPQGAFDLDVVARLTPVPSVTLHRDSSARVHLQRGASEADLALTLPEPVTFTLDAHGRIASPDRLALRVMARDSRASMEGDFRLLAPALTTAGDMDVRIEGGGEARWPEGGAGFETTLQMAVSLPRREFDIAAGARLDLAPLHHGGLRLSAAGLSTIEMVRLDLTGTLLAPAELKVVVDDPDRLILEGGLTLSPNRDATLRIRAGELPLAGNDVLAAVLPPALVLRSGRLEFDGSGSRTQAGRIQASWSTRWQGVGLDVDGVRLRGASGSATSEFADEKLAITASTTRFDQLAWRPAAGSGSTLQLQRGRFTGTGTLALASTTWQAMSWTGDGSLEADDLIREELRGRGLTVAVHVGGAPRQPTFAGRARLSSADAGIPLGDIDCSFALGPLDRLELEHCSATMLGGDLRMPRGTLDPVAGSGYLPMAIDGIDLGALLALMQDASLDGVGTLDGSVPLRLVAWQPVVEQGWLAARPPGGSLTYATPSHVLAGIEQPALRLALRAVRDLRYQQLGSRVDYGEDGTLTLGVELLGSNPEIEGGRPIRLNLNVTQNLLELLRSLQLSEQVARDIERRLERVQR